MSDEEEKAMKEHVQEVFAGMGVDFSFDADTQLVDKYRPGPVLTVAEAKQLKKGDVVWVMIRKGRQRGWRANGPYFLERQYDDDGSWALSDGSSFAAELEFRRFSGDTCETDYDGWGLGRFCKAIPV